MSKKYKLVPVEPTSEMLAAGERALDAGCYASGIYADILAATPEVEQEPVAWVRMKGSSPVDLYARKKQAELFVGLAGGRLEPLYLHPQPAPDAALAAILANSLVELLDMQEEECRYDHEGYCQAHNLDHATRGCRVKIAREALAAHRKQGGEPVGAEQQPDVTLLLELLSHARCNTCDGSGGLYDNHGHPHQCQWCHDRSKALAAHRKGVEE